MPTIILKKNEERRLLKGHQWIFSNEIEKKEEVNSDICVVALVTFSGRFLGQGFYNKHSLIAYRHLTDTEETIDENFLRRRMIRAYELRKKLNSDREVFRLVNSESDFLPGLIIDKFEDKYSIQIFSAGMELFFHEIIEILKTEFKATTIVEKNNNDLRTLEGLELREGLIFGGDSTFEVKIDDIEYNIDLLKGQKTGFYLDQTDNRKLIRNYVKKNHKILDLFCNEGGFALNAAYAGAENITAVDNSEHSINMAKLNAESNGFTSINFVKDDIFDYLDVEFQTSNKYDVIILDPPSFTKSRKTIMTAVKGYTELNSKCLRLLNYNSLLFTFSCSHHISEEIFQELLGESAFKANRKIQLIHKHVVSNDHPVLLQMNETGYLKGYLFRVV